MRFISIIQDDTGAVSSTRCVFLAFILCFLIMWVMDCWNQKKLADIPFSVISVLITLMTGKVTQSITENIGPK